MNRAYENKKKYNAAYDKANCRQFLLALNKRTDAVIIKKLDEVPNKTDYIRQLILKDLEK